MGRSRWILGVLVVVAQLAIVGVAADLFASTRNTLTGHPEWTSSKAQLEKQVMSAQAFTTSRQSLAGDHLDLSAFHGFQEVRCAEPQAFDELCFRVELAEDAYVQVLFHGSADGAAGVRLSRHPRFDEVFFEVTPEGRFTSARPVQPGGSRMAREGWMDVRLRFEHDAVALTLDGRPAGDFAHQGPERQVFGFRGGERQARIDDVTLLSDGKLIWREDFTNTEDLRWAQLLGILGVLLADVLLLVVARARGWRPRQVLFGTLIGVAVALVLAVSGYLVYRFVLSDSYGPADPEAERAWRDEHLEEVATHVRETWAPREPGDDELRVLFLGTSQTWGAGASTAERTFVRRIERALAENRPDRRVSCLNAGVMGSRLPRLFPLYRDEWIALEPDLVVVDLANNDSDSEVFTDRLDRLVRLNRTAGIATVFALEPNSVEHTPDALPLHADMREIAATYEVPVVDLHGLMRDRSARGFLWWDFVHPADEGHRIIAEALLPTIEGVLPRGN